MSPPRRVRAAVARVAARGYARYPQTPRAVRLRGSMLLRCRASRVAARRYAFERALMLSLRLLLMIFRRLRRRCLMLSSRLMPAMLHAIIDALVIYVFFDAAAIAAAATLRADCCYVIVTFCYASALDVTRRQPLLLCLRLPPATLLQLLIVFSSAWPLMPPLFRCCQRSACHAAIFGARSLFQRRYYLLMPALPYGFAASYGFRFSVCRYTRCCYYVPCFA